MKNPQEAYKMGQRLLEQNDPDMASLYFESAGENFLEISDKQNALKAYAKALSCFELLERDDHIVRVKNLIAKIV